MSKDLKELEGKIGYKFDDFTLFTKAMIHSSYANEKHLPKYECNERLEFLGDAILDAVVADIVYKKFEGKREGFLTNTRSKIVQRETLNQVAVQIGLDKLIKFTTRQSSHNSYMSGNAFEALVGAIYLDRGYDACKKFMEERIIAQYLNIDKISRKEVNFKSKLIEWSQKNKFEVEFRLTGQSIDSDSNPIFETQVMVENIPAGEGKGYSKKESQQLAAQETLKQIKTDPKFIDQIFAAKAQREQAQETTTTEVPEASVSNTPLTAIATEEEVILEKFEDTERIISEAEEAAFKD